MNAFSVTNRITYPEFRNLNYKIAYRKKWIAVISVLGLIAIIASLVAYFTHNDAFFDSWFFSIGFGLSFWIIFLPIMLFLGSLSRYKTNKALHAPVVYEFSEEGVSTTSEYFSSQFKWEKLYKIEMIGPWLLLYQSRSAANFIKFDDPDSEDVEELKKFLKINSPKVKVYAAKPV